MEWVAITQEKPSAWILLCAILSYTYCGNATATEMVTLKGTLSQESGLRGKVIWFGNRNWLRARSAFERPEMKTAAESCISSYFGQLLTLCHGDCTRARTIYVFSRTLLLMTSPFFPFSVYYR